MQASISSSDKVLQLLQDGRVIAVAMLEAAPLPLIETLARLAVSGVRCGVIVANNQFDVVRLADGAEQLGADRDAALQQIHILRAETCAQVHGCLQRLARRAPSFRVLFIVGLLAPFYDEDIRLARAQWLLMDTLNHLQVLAARGVAILVTVSPPPTARRESFLALVQGAADLALVFETPRLPLPQQMQLEL